MKKLICIMAAGALLGALRAHGQDTIKVEERYLWPADYMADPSARVFDGKIYIYPSHDWDSPITDGTDGNHFDMKDYHVFSIDGGFMDGKVTDHGVIIGLKDVPWAERQLWAPDAIERDGRYYFYFTARDKEGLFRLGVAEADTPVGPFKVYDKPIEGTYSIDPTVFADDDGSYYIYFGGLSGGQLQNWIGNEYHADAGIPDKDQPAASSRVARLNPDMKSLAEAPREVKIVDKDGNELKSGDPHRYFEAPWMHRYNGKYYYSYSTGTSHMLCYAVGDNPYGPFTYAGEIMTPVVGWTTHHSILEHQGRWWLVCHDSKPSGGKSRLRSMKVMELTYRPDGTIVTIDGGK